jgi:benzoyl-CoA 2,3-epoxidase subunit A
VMLQRAADVAALLKDDNTYIYVCGLKGMETGVIEALKSICDGAGIDWAATAQAMKTQGRIHLETY